MRGPASVEAARSDRADPSSALPRGSGGRGARPLIQRPRHRLRHRDRLGRRRRGRSRKGAAPARHHGVGLHVRRLDRLAEARHQQLRAALRRRAASSVSAGSSQACIARLKVPQCTGRKAPPPSSASASSAFAGPEVDVAPGRVEGADLEHHQVEGAEALADLRVLGRQAGVAAEEHASARGVCDHERRPQRGVAVRQAAAGEVLRGRGGDASARASGSV